LLIYLGYLVLEVLNQFGERCELQLRDVAIGRVSMVSTDIQVIRRVIYRKSVLPVASMYWKLYLSPCGKSSLAGTWQATIS
jgi:hypothetical protein